MLYACLVDQGSWHTPDWTKINVPFSHPPTSGDVVTLEKDDLPSLSKPTRYTIQRTWVAGELVLELEEIKTEPFSQ